MQKRNPGAAGRLARGWATPPHAKSGGRKKPPSRTECAGETVDNDAEI